MAVLDALKRMEGFTNAEKDLARYILDHLDDVAEMNIATCLLRPTPQTLRWCASAASWGWMVIATFASRWRATSRPSARACST